VNCGFWFVPWGFRLCVLPSLRHFVCELGFLVCDVQNFGCVLGLSVGDFGEFGCVRGPIVSDLEKPFQRCASRSVNGAIRLTVVGSFGLPLGDCRF
jgi:hypothetical protein